MAPSGLKPVTATPWTVLAGARVRVRVRIRARAGAGVRVRVRVRIRALPVRSEGHEL